MDLSSILDLFLVAFMPVLQVLILSGLGAFMATRYLGLLPAHAIKSLNKIVFTIFAPSLTFSSLANTVNFRDLVSWWFMPVNVGLTFLFGAIFGKGLVKLLKPEAHIRGLVVASCSASNLGNLVMILIPAICNQDGSPFGDHVSCKSIGLSYTAFSMALGGLYMWTSTYQLLQSASMEYKKSQEAKDAIRIPNGDEEAQQTSELLNGETKERHNQLASNDTQEEHTETCYQHMIMILKELRAPPTIGALLGLVFGTVPWLRHLIIGDHALLHVIQDCIQLLGDGAIPCITLILGGNLKEGLHSGKLDVSVILGVVIIKYLVLPPIGMGVVWLAGYLGFLPANPLYHFILMVQFTLPPAMSIVTMTELFDVGQKECSVLFLWTYLVAAFALAIWCTIYMWILS